MNLKMHPHRVLNLLCPGPKTVLRKTSLLALALFSFMSIYGQFESSYTILDSMLFFSYTSGGDSTCLTRTLFQSNEHGQTAGYTEFKPGQEGSGWDPSVRKYYSYNPFGQRDSISEDRINTISGQWDNASLWTYSYNEQDRMNSWAQYNWDKNSDSWYGLGKRCQDFDLYGNLIYDAAYSWDITESSWVENRLITWIKDENGLELERNDYTWSVADSDWLGSSRNESFYNEAGQDTLRKQYFWDGVEGEWTLNNQYRSEYILDGENRIDVKLMYSWGYIEETWELTAKSTFRYATEGDTISEEFFLLQNNGDWKPAQKENRIFGPGNRLHYWELYSWNDLADKYEGNSKYTRDYNNAGQITLDENYRWDSHTWAWIGKSRSVNEYRPDGNQDMGSYDQWNVSISDWELTFRTYYYYTEVNELAAPQISVMTDTVAKYTEIDFISSQDARVYLVPAGSLPDSDLEEVSLGMSDVFSLETGSISTSSVSDSGVHLLYAVNPVGLISLASRVWITLPQTTVPMTAERNIRIYPTLVNHSFTIESEQPVGTIELYDLYGRLVKVIQGEQQEVVIVISDLKPGIYCVMPDRQKDLAVMITKM